MHLGTVAMPFVLPAMQMEHLALSSGEKLRTKAHREKKARRDSVRCLLNGYVLAYPVTPPLRIRLEKASWKVRLASAGRFRGVV